VARDGAQAVAMVDHRPPTLMALDPMLPEVDGWDVCR
jgi:DNA-binding response OmpR family regulator